MLRILKGKCLPFSKKDKHPRESLNSGIFFKYETFEIKFLSLLKILLILGFFFFTCQYEIAFE